MPFLKGVAFTALITETIRDVRHGHALMPKLNPYNGYSLYTESGRVFVVWNTLGETNLSEVIADKP